MWRSGISGNRRSLRRLTARLSILSVTAAVILTPVVPTSAMAESRSLTVVATGDFLLHTPVQKRGRANAGGNGYDFRPMLSDIRPIVSSADLAICHMETPISSDNRNLSSYPVFNVPHQIADAIKWAGYDTCSTASNHSLDKGAAGVVSTLNQLQRAGLAHVGTARSRQERNSPPIYDIHGIRVGHLSYAYGFNGFQLPPDKPWLANTIDPGRIIADAKALRARGAEVVIASLHWGTEYQHAPNALQQRVAPILLGSGQINLILGHHAHVVQPIVRTGTGAVIYGHGNLLSGQSKTGTRDGLLSETTLAQDRPGQPFTVRQIKYRPLYVDRPSYKIRLATPSSFPDSFRRTRAAVELLGRQPGVVAAP